MRHIMLVYPPRIFVFDLKLVLVYTTLSVHLRLLRFAYIPTCYLLHYDNLYGIVIIESWRNNWLNVGGLAQLESPRILTGHLHYKLL